MAAENVDRHEVFLSAWIYSAHREFKTFFKNIYTIHIKESCIILDIVW